MLLDLEPYWTIPNCQPWWRNQALKDAFWVPIYFPQKQVDPTDPATSERHHNEFDTRKRWAARRFDIPDDPKISPVRRLISDQVESEKNTLWQTSTTMKNPLKKW